MKNTEVVTLVRGLFQEQETRLGQKLEDLKENLRDEMHSCISASEHRMMNRMDGALERVKTEIIDAIGEIFDESVLPQISDLQIDMRQVKNHLQMA